MKTALAYGADAVYLGIPDFSLRVRINDFDLKSIKEAIKYAHERDKKVYVTLNIFAHNRHLKKIPAYLQTLKKLAPDALIISDPGIIMLVKKYWPSAEIHLSTQANCTNSEAVKFWAKQGVKRIILGREVTLKEIEEIHRAVPKVELEYFIHGAMCMAYSGRCFLSKMMLGRSGNLGDCAQPCRFSYDLKEFNISTLGHGEELELVEEQHGSYILNSKDLCLLKYLRQLAAAGVTSFKIEGRAKSSYYQAIVCGVYRRALELIVAKVSTGKFKKELDYLYNELKTKLVHRGYTTGFLLGAKADQNIKDSHNQSAWEFCGQVLKVEMEKSTKEALSIKIYFKVHNTIKAGDELEIIGRNYDIIKIKPKIFYDAKTGVEINEAHGGGGSQTAILKLSAKELKGREIFPLAVLRRLKKTIKL
jgi:putative protease